MTSEHNKCFILILNMGRLVFHWLPDRDKLETLITVIIVCVRDNCFKLINVLVCVCVCDNCFKLINVLLCVCIKRSLSQ